MHVHKQTFRFNHQSRKSISSNRLFFLHLFTERSLNLFPKYFNKRKNHASRTRFSNRIGSSTYYFPPPREPNPPHRIRNRGHQGSLDRKCSNDGARLIDANTGQNFVVKRHLFLIPRMCFLVFDQQSENFSTSSPFSSS